jgi:hypothetical protein
VPRLSAEIPASLKDAIDEEAARSGRSLSSIVIAALARYLERPIHTVFQVSTSGALVAGVYDREVSVRTVLDHGDFGLGTFANLDGEMVVVNGRAYQILGSDGGIHLAAFARRRIEGALVDYVLSCWPQVQAGTAAQKMKLFFDLCSLKAGLTARCQQSRSRRSAAPSSRRGMQDTNALRPQPRDATPRTTSHLTRQHWAPTAAANFGVAASAGE